MSKYVINTQTGLLFEKTPAMDMRAHMEPYQPSKEEVRIGRKIEKAPKVKAHEEAEEPEAETPAVEVEVATMAPVKETEVDLGTPEPAAVGRQSPEVGMDGGDADAAAAAPAAKTKAKPRRKAKAKRKAKANK